MNKEIKIKKLTPRNSAPVKRENTATIASDSNAIAPAFDGTNITEGSYGWPFAGDDAE